MATMMELPSTHEDRASLHNPSSCYAPQSDYHHRYDPRYALNLAGPGGASSRQPLEESTGNVQYRTPPPNGGYSSQHHELDPYIQSLRSVNQSRIPTPPIIPSQGLPPLYSHGPSPPPTATGPGNMALQRQRRSGMNGAHMYYTNPSLLLLMNPLSLSPGFAQYRKRQAEKEIKDGQVWPDWLEAPFLDALLFLPHIGKKKFQLYVGNPKQFGRNQLIEEYLKIVYELGLPPGAEPSRDHERERKKVSSHIQVIKNFFKPHPYYHLIFTAKETKTASSRRTSAVSNRSSVAPAKNGGTTENLNNHPVLAAMRQRRLPSVRPNYEYFAALLKAENQVLIKPRRCWILVAHEHYAVVGHEQLDEDGNPTTETTYSAHNKVTGTELAHPEDYPYLRENLFKESWPREERQTVNGSLLHQYTKSLEQVESCSAIEMSAAWSEEFPELAKRLDLAVEESVPEWDPAMVNPHRCEILHYHLTLELQRRPFPKGSELYPWVEINVEQAHLANHRWKVVTRLIRPKEFVTNGTERTYDEFPAAEMRVQPVHRPGCDANTTGRDCDCRRRQQVLNVPFPADVMAKLLSKCVEYPAHPLIGSNSSDESKNADRGSKGKKIKTPTQMELVPQVAMCQEMYSCPADLDDGSKNSDPETDPSWKRRAMILWSFETIHSTQLKTEDKTKRKYESLVTAPSGKATWRFLSAIDPTSRHHQERTIIRSDQELEGSLPSIQVPSAASRHLSMSREAIPTPSPNYQQHFNTNLNTTFGTTWDNPTTRDGGMYLNGGNSAAMAAATNGYQHHSGQGMYQPALAPTGPGGLSILASQHHHRHHNNNPHGGLQTPPPTSSLNGSFPFADNSGSQQSHHPHPQQADMQDPAGAMSFISVTSADTDNYLAAATSANRAYSNPNLYTEMGDPTVASGAADPSFPDWATATTNAGTAPPMTALYSAPSNNNNWQSQPHPQSQQQQQQQQYHQPTAPTPSASGTAATNSRVASIDWVPSPHESPITQQQHHQSISVSPHQQQHLMPQLQQQQQYDPSPSVSPKASTIPSTHRDSQDSSAWVADARITPATDLNEQEWEVAGVVDGQQQVEEQQQVYYIPDQRGKKRGREWDGEVEVEGERQGKMARLDE